MITGTLSGTITADPVVRQGQSGNFTTFSVAVNHNKEKTTFVDCTASGKTGDLVAEHFKKANTFSGPAVFQLNEYESNGQKKQVLAATILMIDWQASRTTPKDQQQQASQQPPQGYNQQNQPVNGYPSNGYPQQPANGQPPAGQYPPQQYGAQQPAPQGGVQYGSQMPSYGPQGGQPQQGQPPAPQYQGQPQYQQQHGAPPQHGQPQYQQQGLPMNGMQGRPF